MLKPARPWKAQWPHLIIGSIPEVDPEAFDTAKESLSGKDGKVSIGGFWGLYLFSRKPSLTVYKPGYVIWNSRMLCPASQPRTDFDENNRTVKLLKLDSEASRWAERYPKEGLRPRVVQDLCFSCFTYDSSEIANTKFWKIFHKHEALSRTKKNLKEEKRTNTAA